MADETAPVVGDNSWNVRFDNYVRAAIALMMVGQFVFLVIYAQVMNHPVDSNTFVVDVGLVTGAVGYYIGGSSGSTNKNPIK